MTNPLDILKKIEIKTVDKKKFTTVIILNILKTHKILNKHWEANYSRKKSAKKSKANLSLHEEANLLMTPWHVVSSRYQNNSWGDS